MSINDNKLLIFNENYDPDYSRLIIYNPNYSSNTPNKDIIIFDQFIIKDIDYNNLNYNNKLELRKLFFSKHNNIMPPIILYDIKDFQNGTFINDQNTYHFTIPDIQPLPHKSDLEYHNKINLIYDYSLSNNKDYIIIKKIDKTFVEIKNPYLYESLLDNDDISITIANELINLRDKILFYHNNTYTFPPLKFYCSDDFTDGTFINDKNNYHFEIPCIIPDNELDFNKFDYQNDLDKHIYKLDHIWKYQHIYKDAYSVTKIGNIHSSFIDTDNKIKAYLEYREHKLLNYYQILYNNVEHLINSPNENLPNMNSYTYNDIYNNSTDTQKRYMDFISIEYNERLNYYQTQYIPNTFPNLSYYNILDLKTGVFIEDKNKYKFPWPIFPPDINEYKNKYNIHADYELSRINDMIHYLFKYTKLLPNNNNDFTYNVQYIDGTSINFQDNNNIIFNYLNNINKNNANNIKLYNIIKSKHELSQSFNKKLNKKFYKKAKKRKFDNSIDSEDNTDNDNIKFKKNYISNSNNIILNNNNTLNIKLDHSMDIESNINKDIDNINFKKIYNDNSNSIISSNNNITNNNINFSMDIDDNSINNISLNNTIISHDINNTSTDDNTNINISNYTNSNINNKRKYHMLYKNKHNNINNIIPININNINNDSISSINNNNNSEINDNSIIISSINNNSNIKSDNNNRKNKSNNKAGRKSQGNMCFNKRYHIFTKDDKSEWDVGSNNINNCFLKWFNRCKVTLEKLSWCIYQLNDNTFKSYICAQYVKQGGKSYSEYLPPGFYPNNDISREDILLLELGIYHYKPKYFRKEWHFQNEFLQEEYEDHLEKFKFMIMNNTNFDNNLLLKNDNFDAEDNFDDN